MSERSKPNVSVGQFTITYTWDGQVLAEVIQTAKPNDNLPSILKGGEVIRTVVQLGPWINAHQAIASLRRIIEHLKHEGFPATDCYAAQALAEEQRR